MPIIGKFYESRKRVLMHNLHRNPLHRQAFDLAVTLYRSGTTDYLEISKQLDHQVPRYHRQSIAAKVCRIMRRLPTDGENASKWTRFCKNVESTPNHVETVRNWPFAMLI